MTQLFFVKLNSFIINLLLLFRVWYSIHYSTENIPMFMKLGSIMYNKLIYNWTFAWLYGSTVNMITKLSCDSHYQKYALNGNPSRQRVLRHLLYRSADQMRNEYTISRWRTYTYVHGAAHKSNSNLYYCYVVRCSRT